MLAFHSKWFIVVVLANLAGGIWGLVLAKKRRPAPKAFWRTIVAGQAALAIQVIAGVILFQKTKPPGQHVFYGFMLLFTAVAAWMFRGEGERRPIYVMAGVATFIGIVAVRAALTAG